MDPFDAPMRATPVSHMTLTDPLSPSRTKVSWTLLLS